MVKITAAEARNIAGPTVEERVEEVYPLIREAAEKKMRGINLRDDFWANGGYSKSDDWRKACDLLRKDGYNVSFFYQELQFVDMGTTVEW